MGCRSAFATMKRSVPFLPVEREKLILVFVVLVAKQHHLEFRVGRRWSLEIAQFPDVVVVVDPTVEKARMAGEFVRSRVHRGDRVRRDRRGDPLRRYCRAQGNASGVRQRAAGPLTRSLGVTAMRIFGGVRGTRDRITLRTLWCCRSTPGRGSMCDLTQPARSPKFRLLRTLGGPDKRRNNARRTSRYARMLGVFLDSSCRRITQKSRASMVLWGHRVGTFSLIAVSSFAQLVAGLDHRTRTMPVGRVV